MLANFRKTAGITDLLSHVYVKYNEYYQIFFMLLLLLSSLHFYLTVLLESGCYQILKINLVKIIFVLFFLLFKNNINNMLEHL